MMTYICMHVHVCMREPTLSLYLSIFLTQHLILERGAMRGHFLGRVKAGLNSEFYFF